MKFETITVIVIWEDLEKVEFIARNRVEATEIVRDVIRPPRTSPKPMTDEYPLWTWFLPNATASLPAKSSD